MRAPGPGGQADQADALGSDQSSEPSRPRRTRGPSPEPRRSAFGRPLPRPPGSLPVAFGRPPRPVCVAATSQVEGAFGRVVVAAEWCSQGRHPNHDGLHSVVLFDVLRDPFQPPSVLSSSPRCWWHWFMSGSCSASCTRCIRSVAESEDPGVEDGGQDKGEAPYLNYRLEITRDYRPL
jgi:hypothetical protein